MNVAMVVGGAFLLLGAAVFLIIACLPSPIVSQLIRDMRKRSGDRKTPKF
jgi:hypothetical protein